METAIQAGPRSSRARSLLELRRVPVFGLWVERYPPADGSDRAPPRARRLAARPLRQLRLRLLAELNRLRDDLAQHRHLPFRHVEAAHVLVRHEHPAAVA